MAYSGGNRAGAVLIDEREARRMLQVLELDELVDAASLDRQYKRLIKRHHPDLNPDDREGAHDRSQAVINAARVLRTYLERQGPLQRVVYQPRRPAPVPGAAQPAAPKSTPRPRRQDSAFQLIEGRRVNYALPVKHIVKIIGVRDRGVHRAAPGPYCCMEGEIFPLHNLEGEDLPWEEAAFIVLVKSPLLRVGIVLPRDARFGGIEHYRTAELIRGNPSRQSHGVWIRHNMKFYLCPTELLQSA